MSRNGGDRSKSRPEGSRVGGSGSRPACGVGGAGLGRIDHQGRRLLDPGQPDARHGTHSPFHRRRPGGGVDPETGPLRELARGSCNVVVLASGHVIGSARNRHAGDALRKTGIEIVEPRRQVRARAQRLALYDLPRRPRRGVNAAAGQSVQVCSEHLAGSRPRPGHDRGGLPGVLCPLPVGPKPLGGEVR